LARASAARIASMMPSASFIILSAFCIVYLPTPSGP